MNRQDFQRNFQWSYFGLVGTPKLLNLLKTAGVDTKAGYAVTPGQIIPAFQPQINGSENSMLVYVVLPTGDEDFTRKRVNLPWSPDCDEDATYIHAGVPVTGMVQGKYSAIYVSRIPARDTPRGYSTKYSRPQTVNGGLMRQLQLVNYTDESLVWRVYNKTYIPWSDAIEEIEDGTLLGAAIDKFLALGILTGRPHTQIFYKGAGSVGYIKDKTPFVYPDSATYALREYIRKIAGIMPEARVP